MNVKTIYVAVDGKAADFAVEEFKAYFKQMTGQDVIVAESASEADLVIADNRDAQDLPAAVSGMFGDIFEDGYAAGNSDGKVYLIANCGRGILYGAYGLLKQAGVVFAAPRKEFVPQVDSFTIDQDLAVTNPKMKFRGIGFHNGWTKSGTNFKSEIDWIVKMGLNWIQFFPDTFEKMRDQFVDEVLKREMLLDVGAHSAFFFLPPAKYLESNPELYSRTADGEMIGKQLCYGNPATGEKFAEACLEYLTRRPEIKILGLWPEDGGGDCHCEWCQGKDRQKMMGAVVNVVAERLKEQYPDVMVNHLAYCQFIKPQKDFMFTDNVLVNHCDYWSRTINKPIYDLRYGQSVLLTEEAKQSLQDNDRFVRDHIDIRQELVDWKNSTSNLTAFSYYSDLVMKQSLLTDVSQTIKADLEFYQALGMKGFVDCCCYPDKSMAFAFNWFSFASFAWETDKTREDLLREFTVGYFGQAASEKAIQVYDLVAQLMDEPSFMGYDVLDLYHRDSREVALQCGIVDELIEAENKRIETMLDKLQEAVNQPGLEELKVRVEDLVERYPIEFALYAAWANIDRRDVEKAEKALAEAQLGLQNYRAWNEASEGGYEQYVDSFERFISAAREQL